MSSVCRRRYLRRSKSPAGHWSRCHYSRICMFLILNDFRALIMRTQLGILAHAFPPSRTRSIAFATFSAGAPIGAGLGTTLGSVLTEMTSYVYSSSPPRHHHSKPQFDRQTWRSTFYFTTGLTFLCLVGGIFAIDRDLPSTETDRRLDWIGAALVSVGLVLIVFVLSQGEIASQKWRTPCKQPFSAL